MRKLPLSEKKVFSIKALHEQSWLWLNAGRMSEIEFFDRWRSELERIRQASKKYCAKFRSTERYRKAHRESAMAERAKLTQEEKKEINRRNYLRVRVRSIQYSKEYRMKIRNCPVRLAAWLKRIRERAAVKRKTDIKYKIKSSVRSRIWCAVHAFDRKRDRTIHLLGCSAEEYKAYLEDRWLPGMSWDNYGRGGWHIDHIIPCSKFDMTDPEQQKRCFHYTNTQPLWEFDNLSKGDKI